MIPEAYIREWESNVRWQRPEMIEQDLIISRALVTLFSEPLVAEQLLFRGGTALHKVCMAPPTRYSEDIDLVQMSTGPIGPAMTGIRAALDSWLGEPQRTHKEGRVTMVYRFNSEASPVVPLRLKVEINTREHFSVLGYEHQPFDVSNRWFTGHCQVSTYKLDELLGTKLRALYQRRKGRDLYDIWLGLTRGHANAGAIVQCFCHYMKAMGLTVSRREFLMNMELKMKDAEFLDDTVPLLREDVEYSPEVAYSLVEKELLARL